MATTQEAIRRLSIQATVSGVDAATGQLEKLAGAQNDVAVASANTEKATLSLDGKFASIERRYVAQVRAQQDYEKVQRQVNAAVAQNPALQDRANTVLAAAKQKLDQVTGGANDNAKAVGLQRYELINLGRQAQDVFVSLASGQNLWTVGIQQGTQALDIFSSSTGTVGGFFKQAGSWLTGFLTAGRIAFGGVTALIVGSVAALNSYLAAQQKVNFSLLGAGRASGATAGSINSAAQQGASTFGLSVSEARDLASSLAATGKVANDNILPIVKMGRDIALAFGTDAAGATKILADAFADPVRGADDLNQRLGFLDAATKQNIQNLVAQNDLYGAQRALLDGLQGSLDGFAQSQSSTARGWTAIGNAISNAWTGLGQFLASMAGFGQSVETQLERARQKLASLENQATDYSSGFGINTGGTPAEIAAQRAEVERLTTAYEKMATASARAQAAQQSFAQAATVRSFTPIISQQEELNNQLQVMQRLFDSIANDEAAGERLKAIGITFNQLAAAIDVVKGRLASLKPEFDTTLAQLQLSNRAITAFSPGAKADVARQESLQSTASSNFTPEQRKTLAEQAYQNALKQSSVALSEQARARELTANQAVASQQLEIDLVGKSIGQQTELRANLQARQQLEQQASQNRTAFDNAEFERLQKINAELGKKAQFAAQAAANDNAQFTLQTAFLGDVDQQIASVQRSLHGADWQAFMNDGLSATMRIADGMKQIGAALQDVNRGFFTDFTQAIRNGASWLDALKTAGLNALSKISDKLAQMAADALWSKAFGGASTSSGGIGGFLTSLFGGGGVGSYGQSFNATGLGAGTGGLSFPVFAAHGRVFANDNITPFAGGGAFTNQIVSQPTMFQFANGGVPNLGVMGEAGDEAIMPLTRGSNGKLGVQSHGGGGTTLNITNVNDFRGADPGSEARIRADLDRRDAKLRQQIVADVDKTRRNNPRYLKVG